MGSEGSPELSRAQTAPAVTIENVDTGRSQEETPQSHTSSPSNADPPNPTPQHYPTWQATKRSETVRWRERWDPEKWKNGRVLLLDYVSGEQSKTKRVFAHEFREVESLKKYYDSPQRPNNVAFRVIHVQDALWAVDFLIKKFALERRGELNTTFGRYARFDKPRRRGNKTIPIGRSWPIQRDLWRGISRTAFGLDYLRYFDVGTFSNDDPESNYKFMELNHYNPDEQPIYGYDVYVQRFSVFVQKSVADPELPDDPDGRGPVDSHRYREYQDYMRHHHPEVEDQDEVRGERARDRRKSVPHLRTLDNGNAVIIIEWSQSGSVRDTLIGAREEIESRWRRLSFYLSKKDFATDEGVAVNCMDIVLRDVLKALSFAWEKYLNCCEAHVSILEDKIYENPADETRAPELWLNSNQWLKVGKLAHTHLDIIKQMKGLLQEMIPNEPSGGWLRLAQDDFEKHASYIQESLVKPTENLNELLYRSVGIRDSRHSLQLGTSMWRLSWITFIFLPLTFIVGFFGMNVDTFDANPSIKWYFIAAVPLMAAVLLLWYALKNSVASRRRDPLRRDAYEHIYQELATDHPYLFSRQEGPRAGFVPTGFFSGIKWRLITLWFAPKRTINAPATYGQEDELGTWGQFKTWLVRRWLGQLEVVDSNDQIGLVEAGPAAALDTLGEIPSATAPGIITDVEPNAKGPFRLAKIRSEGGSRSRSPKRSHERPSSATSSGLMIEEQKDVTDDDSSTGRPSSEPGRRARPTSTHSRSASDKIELLNVPLFSPGRTGSGVSGSSASPSASPAPDTHLARAGSDGEKASGVTVAPTSAATNIPPQPSPTEITHVPGGRDQSSGNPVTSTISRTRTEDLPTSSVGPGSPKTDQLRLL